MKLTEDKSFQLKQVKGTIVDTKHQTSWNFTEKNIIHIELEQGNKRLFYEVNDEFKQNQKLRELIEKRIMEISSSHKHFVGDENCCGCKIVLGLQKLLEDSKKIISVD